MYKKQSEMNLLSFMKPPVKVELEEVQASKDLDENTCSVYRDVLNDYKPLEKLFGVLQPCNAFGECALLQEPKTKFYNAIALTDCVLLTVSRRDYISALSTI